MCWCPTNIRFCFKSHQNVTRSSARKQAKYSGRSTSLPGKQILLLASVVHYLNMSSILGSSHAAVSLCRAKLNSSVNTSEGWYKEKG